MSLLTIEGLKKHLGPGLGLRKSKYLLEMPVPTMDGGTINVLCQSAGLPERNISTSTVWHMGRKYQIRGETDFGSEYTISILDDSDMSIRKMFDNWMKKVDNTRPNPNGGLMGSSFEEAGGANIMNEIESGLTQAQKIKGLATSPAAAADYAVGFMDENQGNGGAGYQTDVNIWQIDSRGNIGDDLDKGKVYGYKLQNCFPKSIGIVELSDENVSDISQFSVTLAYSEFIPLYGLKEGLLGGIFGDQTMGAVSGAKSLVGI